MGWVIPLTGWTGYSSMQFTQAALLFARQAHINKQKNTKIYQPLQSYPDLRLLAIINRVEVSVGCGLGLPRLKKFLGLRTLKTASQENQDMLPRPPSSPPPPQSPDFCFRHVNRC